MSDDPKRGNVLVIHGPNLNTLGTREPEVYGRTTLAELNEMIGRRAAALGLAATTFQSNHEGEIVDRIQQAATDGAALIINPAGYTHTSVAIRDAILLLDAPVIEVHISNIFKREPFRHRSMVTDVATGQICGLGVQGYLLALEAVADILAQ
jgi:3-dehydroquinate dehydratase II